MRDADHEHHIHHDSQNNLSSVIVGVVIGAAVAYLFANKEGQKIRDQLIQEGAKLLDELSQKTQEMENRIEDSEVKKELEDKVEDVKKEVEEIEQVVEEIPQHIEQIQKKGRRFFFRKPHSLES